MEKALKEAIEANNLPAIREALVNIIVNDAGKIIPVETVTEVLETTPGIFDVDNGKTYDEKDYQNPSQLIDELIKDLKSNFSPEKFGLLTEICVVQVSEGKKYQMPEDETSAVLVEELQAAKPASDAGSKKEEQEYGKPKCNCGKIINIVIMALGCAAAIVGLCVPVKFLLGLGIGVFMLGTALLYMQITPPRNSR